MKLVDPYHRCNREDRSALYDARGIFCCYVCPVCEKVKKSTYRPEVLTNPNYWADESIESEE